MSKFWSPFVKELVPYVPGEQPKLTKLVKLNTNENPYGPSPKALAAMQAATERQSAPLPRPQRDLLKQAVARYYGVDAGKSSSATVPTKSWPTPSSRCSSTTCRCCSRTSATASIRCIAGSIASPSRRCR
ncbi:MAG: hypothetical protein LKM38_20900 [Pseudomonas veronii]|jgi:hypothetical protein|nr:hypothetical protein [Pseudomonas veronii]